MTAGHMNAGFYFEAQKVDNKSSCLSLDRVNMSIFRCVRLFVCVRFNLMGSSAMASVYDVLTFTPLNINSNTRDVADE